MRFGNGHPAPLAEDLLMAWPPECPGRLVDAGAEAGRATFATMPCLFNREQVIAGGAWSLGEIGSRRDGAYVWACPKGHKAALGCSIWGKA